MVGDVSLCFLRPNVTPQLFARLASLLLALTPVMPVPVPNSGLGEFHPPGISRDEITCEVMRRLCVATLDIPSEGEPSGEGVELRDSAEFSTTVVGAVAIACSYIAVVAAAFAALVLFPNGILPEENREEVDTREALEPGRREGGPWALGTRRIDPGGSEGGATRGDGTGDPIGEDDRGRGGVGPDGAMVGSSDISGGDAWAKIRDNDDGPAVGDELTRALPEKSREFKDCGVANVSSTSGSGGPAGSASACWIGAAEIGGLDIGGLGIGGLVDSLRSLAPETLLLSSRRFVG